MVVALVVLSMPHPTFAMNISEGSRVAGIDVEGQTIDEAKEMLNSRIKAWKEGPPIIASNEYETIEIPREIVQFDLDATFHQFEEKMKRHWSNFFQKPKNVKQELVVESIDDPEATIHLLEHVDAEQTLTYVLQQAKHLTDQPVTLVYQKDWEVEQEEVSSIVLGINDLSIPTIEYVLEELDGKLIETNTLFSFLDYVVLPAAVENAERELSFIASGLYALILETNIEVLERHGHSTIPAYTKAGLEAYINSEEAYDLKLYHEEHFSYEIQAELIDEEAVFTLLAPPSDEEVYYSIENVKEIESRTIYRYNPDLEPGIEQTIQSGKNGLQLEVFRVSEGNEDVESTTERISRDFYAPTHEIIEVSTAQEIEEEIIEEEVEDRINYQAIIDQVESNVNTSEECEADPNLCEDNGLDFLTLLFACALEAEIDTNVPEDAATIEDEETVELEENTSDSRFCNMLLTLFVLGMLNDGEFIPNLNEGYLLNEENDWIELEDEIELEEEDKEVK